MCIGLGVAGIFLPLLPTTPFLLAAMFMLARSNPSIARRLENSRLLGGYIKSYTQKKRLDRRSKIKIISLMWLTIMLSLWLIRGNIYLEVMLIVISIAVTIHISRR